MISVLETRYKFHMQVQLQLYIDICFHSQYFIKRCTSCQNTYYTYKTCNHENKWKVSIFDAGKRKTRVKQEEWEIKTATEISYCISLIICHPVLLLLHLLLETFTLIHEVSLYCITSHTAPFQIVTRL